MMRRSGVLMLLGAVSSTGGAGALLRPTSAATQGDTAAMKALENLPVYLKPSSSSRRRPSFYIPRMREEQPAYKPFPAAALGTALPLFSITSTSCEYYALRLPLLKAGFKRVASATEGVAGNLVWGRAPHMTRGGLTHATLSRTATTMLSSPPPPPSSSSLHSFCAALPPQRFNHFPSSHIHLGCKRGLALHLRRMAQGPAHAAYDFTPATWIYPQEREQLFAAMTQASSDKLFIWKPARGSCGRGIRITAGGAGNAAQWRHTASEIDQRVLGDAGGRPSAGYVVQSYIPDPLLLDGRKMDLRLYVVVTSYDPLVVYWHEEGLVRLAAQPYEAPVPTASATPSTSDADLHNYFRHLTNYSIGRRYGTTAEAAAESAAHESTGDDATPSEYVDHPPVELKWSLQRLWSHLDGTSSTAVGGEANAAGRPHVSRVDSVAASVQHRIAALIVRTLMAVKPTMSAAAYRSEVSQSYFELYGFDVMLDRHLTPYLIEVNTLPSLESSSAFDYVTKTNVVADALNISLMEPFARDPTILQPLLPADKLLTLPLPELRPLVHPLSPAARQNRNRHGGDDDPLTMREELRCRLHDELQYARGLRRIFPPPPPSSPTLLAGGLGAVAHAMQRDAAMYAALGYLSPLDEWALQNH